MKRILLFLLVCFSSAFMFAQEETTYFTPIDDGFEFNMDIIALISLDGVEAYGQENEAQYLEIGIFDQNGICRGALYPPAWKNKKNRYIHSGVIHGTSGYVYHFVLYSHKPGAEGMLETTCEEDGTLTFAANEMAWNANTSNPSILHFTTLSLEKEIVGYGTDYDPETNANAHYYLIASPVIGNVTPAQNNGFIPATGGYDLFYFDQTGDDNHNEWITYKEGNGATNPGFALQNGKGYLYANEAGTTLHFEGATLSGTEASADLVYNPTARWAGWNLVGNPFAKTAYPDRAYYALQNGSELSAEIANSTPVGAMEGIFVKAANAEDNSMTFTTTAPGAKRAALVMNVTRGRSLSDRAIVCFGGNEMLPKFQLRQNSTKVYIPVEGNDFAVVSAEAMGELPVNFRAETSGNYTLNFAAENVSFTYLHLIDNMTGANVDLLQTPFYSFDATTADYASRFRLQFATGNSADGDTFGFFNEAGNLTIFGIEGTATLQVMDINGRILSTDTFSGSYEKQLNVAAGIYMLRLVNGTDVKVQKIVVR